MPVAKTKPATRRKTTSNGQARPSRASTDPSAPVEGLLIQVTKPGDIPLGEILDDFERVDWRRVNRLINEYQAVFLCVEMDRPRDECQYNWRVCIQRQVGRQNADVFFARRNGVAGIWIVPKRAFSGMSPGCYESVCVAVCGSCGDVQ